jgi:hypothetical protein
MGTGSRQGEKERRREGEKELMGERIFNETPPCLLLSLFTLLPQLNSAPLDSVESPH